MRPTSLLSLFAALAVFTSASTASAALNVSVSSADDLFSLLPGSTISIDITLTTTGPEALALGLRAADWGPTLEYVSSSYVPSIFNFSPSVPFGGIPNTLPAPVEDGVGPGNSVNLFQGVALTPAAGAGPETFTVTFLVTSELGAGVINVGAFSSYLDTYIGGDDVVNNAAVFYAIVPEPGTAMLLGLGLAVLATTRRRA